jgi:tRNA(Arg) A34 adenosine deaminase TadA
MQGATYIDIAAQVAVRGPTRRAHMLGAVGIRNDGAVVIACNLASKDKEPRAHAEARLSRKLDVGSVVYVARVHRDGTFGMAHPCPTCMRILRAKGVDRVFYTTGHCSDVVSERIT